MMHGFEPYPINRKENTDTLQGVVGIVVLDVRDLLSRYTVTQEKRTHSRRICEERSYSPLSLSGFKDTHHKHSTGQRHASSGEPASMGKEWKKTDSRQDSSHIQQ